MYLRDLSGPRPRDVTVHIDDPEATVADLSEALAPDLPPGALLVDDRTVAAATPLDRARIGDGAEVCRAGGPQPRSASSTQVPAVVVTVTVGPDAGRRVVLPTGHHPIGRYDDATSDRGDQGTTPSSVLLADPTVSPHQATLTVAVGGSVTVVDAGAHNPTRVGSVWATDPTPVGSDDEVCCGATRFRVTPLSVPVGSGMERWPGPSPRPLHRRGRPDIGTAAPLLNPPPEPDPPPMVTPIGLLGVLASVAVGAAMVVVLGSWLYAIFALLGPVLMVANALDSRRRRRRSSRLGDRRRRADLETFSEELERRRGAAQSARWRRVVGPGEAHVVVEGIDAGLHPGGVAAGCWERRPGDTDAFTVRVGVGDAPWSPPVTGFADGWPDDVARFLVLRFLQVHVLDSLMDKQRIIR